MLYCQAALLWSWSSKTTVSNKTRIEKLSTQLFPVLWISAADLSRTWGKPNNVYLCYLKCKIKSFVTQIYLCYLKCKIKSFVTQICSPPTKSPRLRNLPLSNNCKATVKFFRKKHWALTHQKEDLHSRIEWNQLGYLLCDEIIKELIMKKHFSTKNKFCMLISCSQLCLITMHKPDQRLVSSQNILPHLGSGKCIS